MKNITLIARFTALLTSLIFISGCGTTQESKASIWGGIGAIAGAAIGIKQGKGHSRNTQALYTLIGGGAGKVIGRGIGKRLDAKDRKSMEATAQRALISNSAQTWSNPRNKTAGRAVPGRILSNNSGRTCRTVQETILINGKQSQQNITACKGPNGWVVQT